MRFICRPMCVRQEEEEEEFEEKEVIRGEAFTKNREPERSSAIIRTTTKNKKKKPRWPPKLFIHRCLNSKEKVRATVMGSKSAFRFTQGRRPSGHPGSEEVEEQVSSSPRAWKFLKAMKNVSVEAKAFCCAVIEDLTCKS